MGANGHFWFLMVIFNKKLRISRVYKKFKILKHHLHSGADCCKITLHLQISGFHPTA